MSIRETILLVGGFFIPIMTLAQTTTYKNKSGNTIGHSKQKGNTTIYYNKSGNKTGSTKSNGNEKTYYNREGNKVGKSKIK